MVWLQGVGLEPTEVRVKLRILRSFSCNEKYDSEANIVSGGAGEACVACTIKKEMFFRASVAGTIHVS